MICQQIHRNLKMWWTSGGRTIIPQIFEKIRVSYLETSACQNVDFFFQAICSQFQDPVDAQNAYFKTPGNALSDQISVQRRILISYAADGIESVLGAIHDDYVYSVYRITQFQHKSLRCYSHVDYRIELEIEWPSFCRWQSQCILFHEGVLIQISLQLVPMGPVNKRPQSSM